MNKKPHIYLKFGTWRAKQGVYMGMGRTPGEAFDALRSVFRVKLDLAYNERRHG